MPLRRTDTAPPLSDEDRRLLMFGPQKIGRTLASVPPHEHDRLRRLWAVHGPTLTAAMPRGQTPWFPDRDWFVRQVRGEPE